MSKKDVLIAFFSSLFIIVNGTMFSYFSGMSLENRSGFTQIFIWISNIIVSYSIAYGIFKIWHRDLIFLNLKTILMATIFSVLLVIFIGGFSSAYVSAFIILLTIAGALKLVFKH